MKFVTIALAAAKTGYTINAINRVAFDALGPVTGAAQPAGDHLSGPRTGRGLMSGCQSIWPARRDSPPRPASSPIRSLGCSAGLHVQVSAGAPARQRR